MRLPRPLYYSCLISALVSGPLPASPQPAAPAIPAALHDARDPRAFQIPAADASDSLAAFSQQSGAVLIYVIDQVRGVRTNQVDGHLPPREALERLLANTVLVVVEDTRSGALMIKRRPPAKPGESTPRTEPPLMTNNPSDPSRHPRSGWFAALLAVLTAAELPAQTVPAATEPKEDPIALSPFTVSTDRDTGFVAASSLAGGRLAGDLKDTPVAYSVITRDFIDALGITNAFDAASWSPNTVISVASNGGGYGDDVSLSPGSYNVRGAGGGRGQRNFFTYFAPNDSYAVERFDFGRGPNAVLFGNGSLGGVATTMTKQARFDSDFTEISQGVGSWQAYRTTFDANRRLGSRFAFRVAAVYADANGWRDKQFDKVRSVFLTNSFKLTTNTTVRLEGEYGESKRNQTFTNLADNLSGWDGKTTFSGAMTTVPANANAVGVSRRGAGYLVYDPFSGVNAIMNYQNDPQTLAGGANNAVPLAGFLQGSLPSFSSSGANLLYSYNLPANRFDNAIAGSAFRLPSTRFSLASDAPVIQERFKDIQFTVDHRIGNLFLQAAADINRTNQVVNNIDVRGSNSMFIDINRLLPNGASNPHFLQPYADGNIRRNLNYRNSQAARFAAGYVKDTGKWGNYSMNVMGGLSENTGNNDSRNLSIAQNADHRRWGSTGASLGATDIVRIRRYWSESSRPYLAPTTIRYIDPITGVDKTINPFWAVENDRSDSQQETKTRYKYAIVAFNAKYFKNRFILLGALRGDDFYNYNRQQTPAGDYDPLKWDGRTATFKPDAPADWANLTFIPKDANGVPTGPVTSADNRPRDANGNRQPQYANDRFKDDYNAPALKKSEITRSIGAVFHLTKWLSPYINYAETFNPPSIIQRIDSTFLPPTVAKGTDLGLRGSFFNQRLNVTVTRYVNREQNATAGATITGDLNNLLNANAVGDNSTAGRNIRGLASVPAVFNDLRDREARGYELEAVANLTKQWRLSFNVGLPKVYETNAFRDQIAYLDKNKAVLKQIATDAGVIIDANDAASLDTSIPANNRSPDVNAAINSYNNLVTARKNFVSARRLTQDQPAVNFYTDYTLGVTKLKGLRLGTGVQYRGKQLIGYRASDTIVNPANPATAIDNPNVDAYTPVFSPNSYYTVVATMGYTLRLEKRRDIRFDLRVNNLLNDQGPIYAVSTALRPLNGNLTSPARETVPNVFSLKQPRTITFTTTVKF